MKSLRNHNHFVIGLCGPTGSGKSTLSRIISRIVKAKLIAEPLPKETLDAFASDPVKNGWRLQRAIITSKIEQLVSAIDFPIIVVDRILEEDHHIFLKMHHQLGHLTDSQLLDLQELCREGEAKTAPSSVLIYLTAQEGVLRDRMQADGRPSWLINALYLQYELYSQFEQDLPLPHVKIDTSQTSPVELKKLGASLVETMYAASKGDSRKIGAGALRWCV